MSKNSSEGYYGEYGGRFSPEILYEVLAELAKAFRAAQIDDNFVQAYLRETETYSCRPTPITFARNLSEHLGVEIYVKREDLNHTGAHKLNNVIGQGLLAKRMGKTRLIAETGAGQHGVATATIAARLGLEATIYMGQVDALRQRPNVLWMERLGAKVVEVTEGARTLKDAINEAFRDWSGNFEHSHYLLGTACGPDPFPAMVAWFHSIIGAEAQMQMQSLYNKQPDLVYACVGGGSNALGIFQAFLPEGVRTELNLPIIQTSLGAIPIQKKSVELVGVEAGGKGFKQHAMRLAEFRGRIEGRVGIAQGYKTFFLCNEEGQMQDTHSIAAGLDYIGVSPILAYLYTKKHARFEGASDAEALSAVKLAMTKEGIIPALESAHAFAQAFKEAKNYAGKVLLINQSGRGDKDIFNFGEAFQDAKWKNFIQTKTFDY